VNLKPIVPAILGAFEIAAWVRPPVDGSRVRIIARHPNYSALWNVQIRQAEIRIQPDLCKSSASGMRTQSDDKDKG
jgi:hypothetical protein